MNFWNCRMGLLDVGLEFGNGAETDDPGVLPCIILAWHGHIVWRIEAKTFTDRATRSTAIPLRILYRATRLQTRFDDVGRRPNLRNLRAAPSSRS